MPLTMTLPEALEDDLRQDAAEEGVEPAAALVSICTALLNEVEETPFRLAIKNFLCDCSIDPALVASALGGLVKQCLAGRDEGGVTLALRQEDRGSDPARAVMVLEAWRHPLAHRSIEDSSDIVVTSVSEEGRLIQRAGRMPRAMGKYAHVPGSSEDYSREKRAEIELDERRG